MESPDLFSKKQQLSELFETVTQLNNKDFVGALERIQEATALARELEQPGDLTRALILQSHQLMRLSRFQEAFQCLQEARPICEAQSDLEGLSDICNVSGLAYGQMGQFALALDDLEAAYELSLNSGNLCKQSMILNNIALVWTWLHSFEKALGLFKKAYELACQTPDLFAQGLALGNQGFVYIKRGYFMLQKGIEKARPDYEEALNIYSRLLDHAEKTNYELLELVALRNMSTAHISLGNVTEGLELNRRCLALSLMLNEKRAEGLSWIDFGRGWAMSGQAEKAQEAFIVGLNKLHEANSFEDLAWQHSEYAAFLQSQGQLGEAYLDLKKALEIEQNNSQIIAERQANALEMRVELSHVQREVTRQRHQASQLSKLNASLQVEARQDALTGVGNRRGLEESLQTLWGYSVSTNTPFTVVLADVDHFKQINDLFSHVLGDQVLLTLAQILRGNCRSHDYVGRYGGEEFALLMPGLSPKDAYSRCNYLRKTIELYDWKSLHSDLKVTVSFGFCAENASHSAKQMLELADENLYSAKRAGRNRVFPSPIEA